MRGLLLAPLLVAGCATSSLAPRGGPPWRPPRAPPPDRLEDIRPLVDKAARRFGLDPALVLAVIYVESRFRPETRSPAGAVGLMQLMPRTAAALARRLGREGQPLEDPDFNVEAGSLFLSLLLDRFDGDLSLALAAYNTGPTRVAGWRATGRPLPDYSRRYVAAVLAARDLFAAGSSPGRGSPAELDRHGLRDLLRRQQEEVPPEPLAPASQPGQERADEGLAGMSE